MQPTDEKTESIKPFLSTEFDFDYWKTLFEDDPATFETKRKEMVEGFIQSAPTEYQQRLNGIMFQIDIVRLKTKSPIECCAEISIMMRKSLSDLSGFIGDLNFALQEKQFIEQKDKESATILDFKR